jgi:hypothetical protein
MKTNEQNKKEVMSYLEKSSHHFFESEDGQHWQSIVKIQATGEFVFVKDGKCYPIDEKGYIADGVTAGKTFLKQRFHPCYNPSGYYSNHYGHGPAKKMRAVRWNLPRLELTSNAIMEMQKEKK